MGKVASDKCHKWVFKEPSECEPNISNYWQSSFDAVCTIKSILAYIITYSLIGSYYNMIPRKFALFLVVQCFDVDK